MFAIEPGKDYAVITGDVIASSDLEAARRKELPATIESIAATLTDWLRADQVSPIAIFGGDSWQLLLAKPADALRAALFMRASLLASPLEIDTRLAIAIGGIDFVPEAGIEQADGEALRMSGRLLSELSGRSVSMGFECHDPSLSRHWDLVACLIDALVRTNWTPNRARAVSGALRGLTGVQIGELWSTPITKQTAGRHLTEGAWEALERAVTEYEAAFSQSAPEG
ncbi:hypothetical protein [Botrimarina mediterranea]|uniref:SatD family (SatD) n=1 Tax=Botrimarina mediterranea TaxID=2528022 RepID=A0A518K6B9_9BACT|nr:hypothetical protein [Botrimarina mediterranea]QDV73331.1 hypothetical protein Spa11_15270 [Botrimarina mediterranea]QDV77848.1 hypothetical protein K2D_14530 [Planctomycetes bacterium K2D]